LRPSQEGAFAEKIVRAKNIDQGFHTVVEKYADLYPAVENKVKALRRT